MAQPARWTWFTERFERLVDRRLQQMTEAVAYDVRARARRILEEDGHIDTKFLYNSVYVSTPGHTSPLPPSGEYRSLKTGEIVRRTAQEPVMVSRGAVVGAAAEHAIWVELMDWDSFLFRALSEVKGREAARIMTSLRIE
jgi:hypothetical protein